MVSALELPARARADADAIRRVLDLGEIFIASSCYDGDNYTLRFITQQLELFW